VNTTEPVSVADVGLQNERTSLAWFRTSLSFAGVGALLIRVSVGLSRPVPAALGAAALALSGGTLLTSATRYRRADAGIRLRRPVPSPTRLLGASAAVAFLLPTTLLVAQLVESQTV